MSMIVSGPTVCTPVLAEMRSSLPCELQVPSVRCLRTTSAMATAPCSPAGQADHKFLAAEARQQRIVGAQRFRFFDRDRALDGEVAMAVHLVVDGGVLTASRS
jgi:hypothetical protein